MSWSNSDAIHRHACHALEDFENLRRVRHDRGDDRDLWHSLSHHLRHVAYRSGHEVDDDRLRIDDVRRSHVDKEHR